MRLANGNKKQFKIRLNVLIHSNSLSTINTDVSYPYFLGQTNQNNAIWLLGITT